MRLLHKVFNGLPFVLVTSCPVTKYQRKTILKRKDLFWLMVSVLGHSTPLFLGPCVGRPSIMVERHLREDREKEGRRGQARTLQRPAPPPP
jgi:hypothetical protein